MMNSRILTLLTSAGVAALLSVTAYSQSPAKSTAVDVGAGHIAWFDLTTTNITKSKDFYGKLFAWSFKALAGTDQAVEIDADGKGIGTIRVADGKLSPFNGVVYVQVDDLKGTCQKAKELGATIAPGFPFNLPNGAGAIAVALDPAGHPIGFYSRTPLSS